VLPVRGQEAENLEGIAMIRSTVLANAVATVVAVEYVLCRLTAAMAPQFLSWRTSDPEAERRRRQ